MSDANRIRTGMTIAGRDGIRLGTRNTGRKFMEQRYWIGRKREAMGMARTATSAEARLIHYHLAGLYSVKAAGSAALPLYAPTSPLHAPLPDAPARGDAPGIRR
ncbi:MAG: hypothetical protein JWO81_778 [Alphaproteobacteria bacterium]|nr:hypothetical protein [Alphaproteobacteria bacterium]